MAKIQKTKKRRKRHKTRRRRRRRRRRTRMKRRKKKEEVKNKTLKKEIDDKVLFVFYTFDNSQSWSYGKFPKGWWWAGSGSTAAIGERKSKYEQEESFMGPVETQRKMRSYLDKYFKNLKNKKIIKIYKIANSYSP